MVLAVSVVPCFVAAVVVCASAVLLFSGALVVPALAGSFHFLVVHCLKLQEPYFELHT